MMDGILEFQKAVIYEHALDIPTKTPLLPPSKFFIQPILSILVQETQQSHAPPYSNLKFRV